MPNPEWDNYDPDFVDIKSLRDENVQLRERAERAEANAANTEEKLNAYLHSDEWAKLIEWHRENYSRENGEKVLLDDEAWDLYLHHRKRAEAAEAELAKVREELAAMSERNAQMLLRRIENEGELAWNLRQRMPLPEGPV